MLPRDVIKRSWRPMTGTLSFPTTAKLVASLARPIQPSATAAAAFVQQQQNQNHLFLLLRAQQQPVPLAPPPTPTESLSRFQPLTMPTPLIDTQQPEDKSASTGVPQQHGKKKHHKYMQRDPGPMKQLTLELNRIRRGPPTPSFPEGVPFARIRKLHHLAGHGFKVNTGGRKHKMYFSLKRGR